ncbi:unnamed protein product [Sphagnum troendelagicum]|uniref:Uncharacterized protein n=1 Tax=Sphagnum troendelagicum TaxID=128251 RepID=A0ABP0TNQ7_9BRYO
MGGNLQPLCHPREKEQRGPGSERAPSGIDGRLDIPREEEEHPNPGAHKTQVPSGSPPHPPKESHPRREERYVGPAIEPEAEWTPNAAWADLIHQVELELEEQILRFKFTISERPQLEWSWQEALSKGGMECTILVHIHTRAKGVSVQKRNHLHWKALEPTLNFDNEVAFAAPAHNLLMRSGEEDSTRQALRNKWASLRASPQAGRKKKRFSRLDMTILMNPETSSSDSAQGELLEDWQVGEFAAGATTKPSGSFNPPIVSNKLTYV